MAAWVGLAIPAAICRSVQRLAAEKCPEEFFLECFWAPGSECPIYAEQMDAEGLGRKLLLTPSGDPRRIPEKQTMGAVTVSHKMLTLQALSDGREEAFGCPPAVCPPERPRPFTHY